MIAGSRHVVTALVIATVMSPGCGGPTPDPLSFAFNSFSENETFDPVLSVRTEETSERVTEHPATDPRPNSLPGWDDEHERINAEVQQHSDARVLFIGDSITKDWRYAGSAVWQRYYAARRPLNLGIFGDKTQHLLWRLQNGNLAGLAPETVVLLVGVNNAFDATHQPRHIAAGVAAILAELRRQLPRTQVLLLAILPAAPHPCWLRDKITTTNLLLGTA